jgi:hypothetical protein
MKRTTFALSIVSTFLSIAACGQAPASVDSAKASDAASANEAAPTNQAKPSAATPAVTYPVLKDQYCDASIEGTMGVQYAVTISELPDHTFSIEYWAAVTAALMPADGSSDNAQFEHGEASVTISSPNADVDPGTTLTVQQTHNYRNQTVVDATWTIVANPPTLTITATGAIEGNWTVTAPATGGQSSWVTCGNAQ